MLTSRRPWFSVALVGLAFTYFVSAAPAPNAVQLSPRQGITTLATSKIASYTPFTYYASAGYCAASATSSWSCGANCAANPQFKPVAAGGDGDSVQYWFVGYDPSLKSAIVSHQGTNPKEIEPLVTDGDAELTALDSALFPGLSSSIEVHEGFADAQANTAASVLQAVQKAMNMYGTKNVALTGHSLGAAISLLDAIYIPLHIPSAKVTFIGYGLPRVGNQAFANYVDSQPISVTHINNKEDFIPIMPGQFLGYHHPSGEVHIQDSGAWMACPGQDNPSTECIVGDVPEIWDGSESDHDGPYNGITMGC